MGLLDKLTLWLGGGRKEARVAVLGLDNRDSEISRIILDQFHSGKSSVLRALRPLPQGVPNEAILPTVGVNQDNFQSGGVHFSAWDVGGSRRHRALWERHYRGSDAIVYVVDAADHLRLVVSREELWLVLSHPDVSGRRLPLLVLANKSDRPDALPPAQIAGALGLERIADKSWHICATSATSGAGLQDGVAWLAGQLRE